MAFLSGEYSTSRRRGRRRLVGWLVGLKFNPTTKFNPKKSFEEIQP
jgi:hypothetical protein